jgi:hypothetical protein
MRDRAIGKRCRAGRLLVIGLMLLIAGCAADTGNPSSHSEDSRNSGFYGGISGGYTGLTGGRSGM